ncbi:isocitrate lyase/PEP mutase family protein [Planococcus ruber]|uniref:isocitrate lyase/PEP mutase family protein n=1 Tax=Planococcus ruber TaxID=2027871 RepID=UPI001FED7286|nr:isocitrate lyase/phosphoenolpyruvate mutase family protein [Planococcus ruber]MCJ1907781.1 isocitrate lyase/phosphoenolpyruvate mutase family protein [Planococcus ruber]
MNKINVFHELHQEGELLFLGNAWNAASARALEAAGFQAIGTTSWGIADSFRLPDGEKMKFDEQLKIIREIVGSVAIPVTADIESGYSEETEIIVRHVLQVAKTGAAGINIEDSMKNRSGLRDLAEHAECLRAIRFALDAAGYENFFINARCDVYLQENPSLEEALKRAKTYEQAGASGIFMPGLTEENAIRKLAAALAVPLNLLSLPGLSDAEKLKSWGVRRFSIGNALSDKIFAIMREEARRMVDTGDASSLYDR